jgi:hypothetical protein
MSGVGGNPQHYGVDKIGEAPVRSNGLCEYMDLIATGVVAVNVVLLMSSNTESTESLTRQCG